jgi:mannose-6-phosphate isomerase-like protein (cupin superfamily)
MRAWSARDLAKAREGSHGPYLELLREQSLSVGLYILPSGAVDHQEPHGEDEIYVVLSGRGSFSADEEVRHVGPGDVLFVPARQPHRFHDITDELRLAVIFAPPEGSTAAAPPAGDSVR